MTAGLLTFSGDQLQFADERSRAFVNGVWLEEFVFSEINKLRNKLPEIQDVARSVEVQWNFGKSKVSNELDVVFLANNQLYIIECKTRNFSEQPKNSTNTLYKLDALVTKIGGQTAKGMVASYGQFNDYNKERAALMDLKLCEGENLLEVGLYVTDWITSGF